ncbi:GAF domain-containing protein [Deinococcus sp. KSM4-11]|uniref:GAF domain-containing protein n=1 Tax=Deinococcus sp. KSM4-11 TaxID=2568654 RepID=UPI001454C111|nr:GAF domain-containing protein [Deinococcus sp. KSM4-11]
MPELPPPATPFPPEELATQRAWSFVQTWWRVTQALGTSVTPEHVIDTVVHEGVQALGADAGSVFLSHPDGQALELSATVGYEPSLLADWRHLPLTRITPSTEAFLSRVPVIVETVEQAVHDYPVLRGVMASTAGSLVALPLLVGEETLGVLALTFHKERAFDAMDRAFLGTLASLCAQSLQRSTALAEAQRLNEQLGFLAEASTILSRSLDLPTILDAIAHLTIPRIADWCVIHLPGENGQLEPVTIVHQDPAQVSFLRAFTRRHPTSATADSGVGRVFTTGRAELVPTITDEMYEASPLDEASKEEVRQLQLRSIINVPMVAAGTVVGVLGLARTHVDRAYTPADLELAQQVANRAGKAVENARLHQALQVELHERTQVQRALDAMNLQLEDRVRERTAELQQLNEELQAFAHSVSHDLRTPIRHITSFADLLERQLPTGNARAEQALGQIRHGAQRLTATVDGLLLLSQASQQPLHRTDVNLHQLTRQVIDTLSADATARSVEWRLSPLPTVQGDAGLLTLVLQNLLGNALKYSSQSDCAVVEVSASHMEDGTLISIRDNGVGFDATYAHKLFLPFQRLHHPSEFEGTGLGLANVRRIVQRHGGQVWAASVPGEGATFSFLLPD